MVDNFTPILNGDPLETCTLCGVAVSQFYMFEHEKWHEDETITKAFIKALMKQSTPHSREIKDTFLENPPSKTDTI